VSGAWRGFVFDLGACKCQCIKCPCRGSRCGGGEPTRPSSEAEPHPRGVTAPQARRNLTRGSDWSSSEAEPDTRGVTAPRARRNLTRGSGRPSSEVEPPSREPQPPSEVEVCPCGAVPLERSGVLLEGGWAVCLVGRRGHQGRGPSRWAVSFVLSVFWVRLHFVFYERKWGFPVCLGDLYGCPRQ
jgi:hypothetical protein